MFELILTISLIGVVISLLLIAVMPQFIAANNWRDYIRKGGFALLYVSLLLVFIGAIMMLLKNLN